jgi:rhodanese-related sulfurtransferase
MMATVPAGASLTPAELDELRKEGRDIKLIDLRLPHRFKRGTIPGAMNIPAAVLLEKQLPPLGEVVLFDDGLGEVDAEALAEGLNKRKGFAADVLAGGYAAWREFSTESTEAGGLRDPDVQMVTYQKLARMQDRVLMVDLRGKKKPVVPPHRDQAAGPNKGAPAATAAEPVDALAELCKADNREYFGDLASLRTKYRRRHSADPKAAAATRQGPAVTPLIVLVDDDHKTAYGQYRRLRAEGYRRVVILAGGELALQVKGQSGLGRISGGIIIPENTDKK